MKTCIKCGASAYKDADTYCEHEFDDPPEPESVYQIDHKNETVWQAKGLVGYNMIRAVHPLKETAIASWKLAWTEQRRMLTKVIEEVEELPEPVADTAILAEMMDEAKTERPGRLKALKAHMAKSKAKAKMSPPEEPTTLEGWMRLPPREVGNKLRALGVRPSIYMHLTMKERCGMLVGWGTAPSPESCEIGDYTRGELMAAMVQYGYAHRLDVLSEGQMLSILPTLLRKRV